MLKYFGQETLICRINSDKITRLDMTYQTYTFSSDFDAFEFYPSKLSKNVNK